MREMTECQFIAEFITGFLLGAMAYFVISYVIKRKGDDNK